MRKFSFANSGNAKGIFIGLSLTFAPCVDRYIKIGEDRPKRKLKYVGLSICDRNLKGLVNCYHKESVMSYHAYKYLH
jgi:hypothetical protein